MANETASGSRFWALFLIAVLGLSAVFLAGNAYAYSAAQGEAMSDPSAADPYTFPNIKPCCGVRPNPCAHGGCRPPIRRTCHSRPRGCDRHHDDNGPYPGGGQRPGGHGPEVVTVTCGGGYFRSIQDAVDFVREGGTVNVQGGFPGPACQGPIVIRRSVNIVGAGDPYGQSRATVQSGGGMCVSVQGYGTVASLANLDLVADGGGACVQLNGGVLHLTNVSINAPHSYAGISVDQGLMSGRSLSVVAGGPALSANAASILIEGANLISVGERSGENRPYREAGPRIVHPAPDYDRGYDNREKNGFPNGNPGGYPGGYPQGYPGGDPDAPYNGGGQIVFVPMQGPPPSYGPENGPSHVRGGAVVDLDGSRADFRDVLVRGGRSGIAAILSGMYADRGVTLSGVRIESGEHRGGTGILAMSSGGYGQPSALTVHPGTSIKGFKTGIDVRGALATIAGAIVDAKDTGIAADRYALGMAERNTISYGDECQCLDGSCGRGERSNGRFSFRGNSCH
jgi:hypothetical protein